MLLILKIMMYFIRQRVMTLQILPILFLKIVRLYRANGRKVTINVPAGTTYFAIHQTTPQTGLMFGIDDVTYTKETPTPIYYGIYKAGALINKVPVTVRHCVDVYAGANTQYAVTAIYADGTESAPVEVNVPTGIENVITDGKPVDVYTVDGKLVRRHTTTLRGLRKGVYVVGNQENTYRINALCRCSLPYRELRAPIFYI